MQYKNNNNLAEKYYENDDKLKQITNNKGFLPNPTSKKENFKAKKYRPRSRKYVYFLARWKGVFCRDNKCTIKDCNSHHNTCCATSCRKMLPALFGLNTISKKTLFSTLCSALLKGYNLTVWIRKPWCFWNVWVFELWPIRCKIKPQNKLPLQLVVYSSSTLVLFPNTIYWHSRNIL